MNCGSCFAVGPAGRSPGQGSPRIKTRFFCFASFERGFLIAIFALICAGCGEVERKTGPRPVRGVLDLRQWEPDRDGPVKLDGEWAFYWHQLGLTEKKQLPPAEEHIILPGVWNGHRVRGETLGGEGFATYRLTILTSPKKELLGLHLLDFNSAYRAYVNGRLIASNGRVGVSKRETLPEWLPVVAIFESPGGRLDLLLEVANFHHRKGGPEYSLTLGSEKQIRAMRERSTALDLFLFGSLLIMGIYHLGLHALRRRDRAPLYFGIFCLLIALRTLLTGEKYLNGLFPGVPWEVYLKLEYISFYLSVPFFTAFTCSVFRGEFKRMAALGIWVITIPFCVLVLVTRAAVYSHSIVAFQIFAVLAGAYVLFVLVLALVRRREGSFFFLLGWLFLFATIINDVLYTNGLIRTGFIVPFGLFLFIFMQAILLSMQFARAFHTAETLTEKLELKVRDRTNELQDAYNRLRELDRAKTVFFTNVSHEIRTPLTLILAPLKMLIDEGHERRRVLEVMYDNGRKLLGLINNLLDVSRVEAGKVEFRPRPVEMVEFLRDIQENFLPAARARGLEMRFEHAADTMGCVADKAHLERIMFNLLANALRFTDRGWIEIRLDGNEERAEISVRDTGRGIEPERLEAIFERFNQAQAAAAPGGTGIGLYLVKRLAALHDGDVRVESEPGKGSTFTLILPRKAEADADVDSAGVAMPGGSRSMTEQAFADAVYLPEGREEEAFPEQQAASDARVLVVEDHDGMRSFLVSLLSPHFRVDSARNGREALERIRAGAPDVIISDVMMPEMDGLELLRTIRLDPELAAIPLLLLTARSEIEDRIEGIEKGADDYVAKPFHPAEVVARLHGLLSREKSRELSIARGREMIHSHLHDHLGGSLTDLSLAVERLRPDDAPGPEVLSGIRGSLRNAVNFLRNVFSINDDLNLLREDFPDGLNLILLRRYANAERQIEFRVTEGARAIFPGPALWTEKLHAICQEIANNDLRYGNGASLWELDAKEADASGGKTLTISMSANSDYKPDASRTGMGAGNIDRHAAELGGRVTRGLRNGLFRIHIECPLRLK